MHTCYKIYDYFEFHLFTYHLSSVVHSATLREVIGDDHNVTFLCEIFTVFFPYYQIASYPFPYVVHIFNKGGN